MGTEENLALSDIHDIIDSNGEGFLNRAFTQNLNTGIEFCLASVSRIESNLSKNLGEQNYKKIQNLNYFDNEKYLNIHIINSFIARDERGRLAGVAHIPNSNNELLNKGLIIDYKYLNTGTLPHEVGHSLGLFHTFEVANNPTFENCNVITLPTGESKVVCCDNDDCLKFGDFVCDTPPDVSILTDCVVGDCENQNSIRDNFMDYNKFSFCDNSFTDGQANRMLNTIHQFYPKFLQENACQGCSENHYEPNNSISQANTSAFPLVFEGEETTETILGAIGKYDDKDIYRLRLRETGMVNIWIEHPTADYDLKLYEEGNTIPISYSANRGTKTDRITFRKADSATKNVYIEVESNRGYFDCGERYKLNVRYVPFNDCPPSILTPLPRDIMDNGSDCDRLEWVFTWTECPNATRYEIEAYGIDFRVLRASGGGTNTTFSSANTGSQYYAFADGTDFSNYCRVRALVNGSWTTWSRPVYFAVEQYGVDCNISAQVNDLLLGGSNSLPHNEYRALKTITSNNIVLDQTNVDFLAGEQIVLESGFTVETGATFSARIQDFTESCDVAISSPSNGDILDNGCQSQDDDVEWNFNWNDCQNATKYHLYVRDRGRNVPMIDEDNITSSSYSFREAMFVPDEAISDWYCRVRAFVNGSWTDWSSEIDFSLEPLNTDCPTTCVPTITTPVEGGLMDNGCSDFSNPLEWNFQWTACSGATKYNVRAKRVSAGNYNLHKSTTTNSYHGSENSYIANHNRLNWECEVQAYINGVWGDWSEKVIFDFEPLNTDCSSPSPLGSDINIETNQNSVVIRETQHLLTQIAPNPFTNQTTINYYLPANTHTNIVVTDINGQVVKKLADRKQFSGWHNINLDATNFAEGIYFLTVQTDNEVKTDRLIIVK